MILESEKFQLLVGTIVGRLQSLEFLLRAFLYEIRDPPHTPLTEGVNLNSLRTGDVVPENALTSFDSLSRLIERYNASVRDRPGSSIDPSLVQLRDAIAHGRISAPAPTEHFHLLRFDRAGAGMMRVAFAEELTEAWLRSQADRVRDAIRAIASNPELSAEYV